VSDFTQAQVSPLKLLGAMVERCTFVAARATLVDFKQATMRDCSFESSDLDKSRWAEATCESTSFRKVTFGNSQFDAGRFRSCDFREAQLRPLTRLPPISMVGAVFEQCDFRNADFTGCDLSGATFRDCKFGGAHGKPAAANDVTVIDADFSDDGDRSDLGGLDDLLEELERCMPGRTG
jgi:fluoroquinolone resistance protein